MNCPHCGGAKSYVKDSRTRRNGTARWRWKVCESCGKKWSTIEIPLDAGRVRRVVLCSECTLQGKCLVEKTLIKAKAKAPFCSEGKQKGDNALYIDEEND